MHGAFARFRAHHRLGASGQAAVAEAESGAVSMLRHVSATAGVTQSAAIACADDSAVNIAPGGLRRLPSQQSAISSLPGAEAQQGSGTRSGSAVMQASSIVALQYDFHQPLHVTASKPLVDRYESHLQNGGSSQCWLAAEVTGC